MSEPHKDRVCTLSYLDSVSGKIISCDIPSTVRVSRYSERELLQDDGKTWKKETSSEEYLCLKHFEQLYIDHPFYERTYNRNKPITDENGIQTGQFDTNLDLGDWTYKIFKSDIGKEVKKE